jgi:pimeloyl-ACP methyl ester carboxylesterase
MRHGRTEPGDAAAERLRAASGQLPLTSITDDAAAVDGLLARVNGPVILAAHSYDGPVITKAATGRRNGAAGTFCRGSGYSSIWISKRLEELGHEVIVANVRELRAISPSDRKSDQVDAEELSRNVRLDPGILRADRAQNCRTASSLSVDLRSQSHRSAACGRGERRLSVDEVLRSSHANVNNRHLTKRSGGVLRGRVRGPGVQEHITDAEGLTPSLGLVRQFT